MARSPLFAISLALTLLTGFAPAARASPALALVPIQGPGAAAVEEAAVKSLSGHRGFSVIAAWDSGPALRQAGVSRKAPDFVQRAGKVLGAALVLRGDVGPRATAFTLYDASSGRLIGRVNIAGKPKLVARPVAATLYDRLKRSLGEALLQVSAAPPLAAAPPKAIEVAPAEPNVAPPSAGETAASPPVAAAAVAPPPAATPSVAEAFEASPAREPQRPIAFEASVGAGTMTRELSYNQDLFGALGGYTLRAGAMVGGELAFYPLALVTRDYWANLGLTGNFAHTLGLSSNLSGGASYPTDADRWGVGARLRVPLEPVTLGVAVGYGREEFRLGTPPGQAPPPVPDYANGFVQAALDLRWQVVPALAILGSGGYLIVADDGIAKSYFPHAQASGLSAGLGLGLSLIAQIELRLAADYQRFFYSFNPLPGEAHIAGGAVDQYLQATLAVALRLR